MSHGPETHQLDDNITIDAEASRLLTICIVLASVLARSQHDRWPWGGSGSLEAAMLVITVAPEVLGP